jgi:hypothetical protein
MSYANKNEWVARPLNRTGNLSAWQQKMNSICPNPFIGQIVQLDKSYTDRFTGEKTESSIGYKVLAFNSVGDAVWQRGQEVYH